MGVLMPESLFSILASFRASPELLAHVGPVCARGLPLTDEKVKFCLGCTISAQGVRKT